MNKRDELEKTMQQAFKTYEDQIEMIAQNQFKTVILPWLKKHNYKFLTGNGAFWIGRGIHSNYDGLDIDNRDEVPQYIYDILAAEVPGMDSNCLGTLMPDYDGK